MKLTRKRFCLNPDMTKPQQIVKAQKQAKDNQECEDEDPPDNDLLDAVEFINASARYGLKNIDE